MKNINYVINGVLAVAVIILFIMQFSGKKENVATPSASFTAGEELTEILPVAYINMDSIYMNYNYYQDINEILMSKEENIRAIINKKVNDLRAEIADFQRKFNNNAFLSQERVDQEQQRLQKKEKEIEDTQLQYAQEYQNEQIKLASQVRETLLEQISIYNQSKGYHLILNNNSDNILYGKEVYDITAEIIEHLNKNYHPSPKE